MGANYQRNVKKAGIFENYTEFYLKRGTSMDFKWADGITNGHKMVKTKFDWSGKTDVTKQFESSTASSIFGPKKKKAAPKKKKFQNVRFLFQISSAHAKGTFVLLDTT